ncbi:MAG: hypothetical protein PHV74_09170 [Dehalococcoidia bacterium]|nr:hypothetical protein [Dehalococcoidia bacterium]
MEAKMLRSMVILVLCLVLVTIPAGSAFAQPPSESNDITVFKIPQLTDEEKERLIKIVFSDKDVADIIGNRSYETINTGVWIHSTNLEKIGGYIDIAFSEPVVQEREWPIAEYRDDEEREYRGEAYTASELATFAKGEYLQYRKWEKDEFRQLHILVDFNKSKGTVVNITPLSFAPLPKEVREAQESLAIATYPILSISINSHRQ